MYRPLQADASVSGDNFKEAQRPRTSLDNMAFDGMGDHWAQWLERKFDEEEMRQAVFDLTGGKAPDPNGVPIAFFQRFWVMLKKDILALMDEFHQRGNLSKGTGASFIALIPKNVR